jgi:hypothetical protein
MGFGGPVDYGAIGEAAGELEYGMAYGDLPGQLEQAALYSDPAALAGLTMRGPGGLRDIASEMGIPGRSTMRKAELVSAIGGVAPAGGDLATELARFGGADIAFMQSRMTPTGAEYTSALMGGRQELYARSQALFGFDVSNVDIALQRAGLGWQQVAGMSAQELAGVLHGPIASEFMARGGARTVLGPETGGEPIYYAPRARADIDARLEGAGESYAGRLVAGAQRASLAQSWMLQRGRTPGQETTLGPQEFYRGAGLVGQAAHLLQEPGIAGIMAPGGGIESLVAGDPAKVAKRLSQLSQEHAISMTGLPSAQSRMLGQLAQVPETVQPARAWVSMGEWMAQGAGLYGTHLGQPYAQLTRRLRLPEGEQITVRPGQRFAGGERVPVFGSHVGLEFGKSYEEIIVQGATPIQKYSERGDPYTEVQFQAMGMMPSGSLVAGKHWTKAGMTGSTLPTQMGLDVMLAPNELYQLGAMIGSVAPPELAQKIWGEGAGRWGPESGRQFAEWLQGPEDPITQKMLELGKLVHPSTGEVLTPETARTAMLPGTGAAISAQLKDIGFEADVGLRLTQAFAGKTQMVKPEAFMALAEQHPRLAHELFRGGLRHQAEMSHVLGAVAANVEPGSPIGQAFIEQAVPMSELGKAYPTYLQQARDVMAQAGVQAPEDQPDVLQGITMGLIGEGYRGRGISMEGEEGTRYLPNLAILGRKFGYPFQENVLNQLPRQVAGLLEYEAARAGGGQYIPSEMFPEGKTPADYTPEELTAMERQYRTGRVEAAMTEFGTATSSKETLMNLLGVRAGKYMVSAHPTAEMGVIPSKYVTSERMLRQMVVAPGASEEERLALAQQIAAGEVEGPRMGVVGYPIVDPGQARMSLGYTTPGEAVARGIAPSTGELEEMYSGRVGVSPLVAYGQEKDWDIDEFLRMVQTKYTRTEGGGWQPQHMARQIGTAELTQMATQTAISGELGRHLEKMGERATMGGVQEWIGRQAGAEPVPIEQLQTSSEDKALGGITKGMMFNVFARRIAGRMRGEPELEEARRTVATPFQTALDIKPVEGGWQGILERMYTFNLGTMGWSTAGEGEGERVPHRVRTLGEWADINIQDVLGLQGMEGGPVEARHLASMLLSPGADRERWGQLTGAIERYQGAGETRRAGMLSEIRQLALGGADLSTVEGMQQVYEQSPVLGAGLEAAAHRAMQKGSAGVEEAVWRQTSRGNWVARQFGDYEAWLAQRGGEVQGYIQAMSPQTHLEQPPSLYERFRAVEAYAAGHPGASPALRASVERAAGLAGVRAGAPAGEALQAAAAPVVPPPPPPLTPRMETSQQFAELQAQAMTPEQRAAALAVDPNGAYAFGPADPARGAQTAVPPTRTASGLPLPAADLAPHEDVTQGLTWSDPLGIARALRAGMRTTGAPPPAAAAGGGGAAAGGGVPGQPVSPGRYSLGGQPPPPPGGAPPPSDPTQPPPAYRAAVGDYGTLAEQYPEGFRVISRPTEGGGQWTGVFPARARQQQGTDPWQHHMQMQFMSQVQGMGTADFLRGVSSLGLGDIAPGLERLRQGRFPTAPQMGRIEGMLGTAGGDLALALGAEDPARGGGRGGATDALDKFTRTVEEARGHLEKYGDTMKEQLDLFSQGKLRVGDKAAWGRDVRAMLGMAQQVTGQAGALGQAIPEQYAGDVAGWAGIMGAAEGAGMGGGIGAGFGGAGPGGPMQQMLAGLTGGGRGFLGAQGPMRGADRAFMSMTSGWRLMMMRRLWGMTGGWAMGQIPIAAQEEQAAAGAAMATMPMGQYAAGGMGLDLMSYGAGRQAWQGQVGRAAYGAWGWTQQGTLGGGLATALGIGMPAVGAGAVAGVGASTLLSGVSATGVGIPVALAAAALGGGAYLAGQTDPTAANQLTMYEMSQRGLGGDLSAQLGMGLRGMAASIFRGQEVRQAGGMPAYLSQQAQTGQQIMGLPMSQLDPSQRVARMQRAIETQRPEWMAPAQAGQLLGQWAAMTPGDIVPEDVLQSPEFAAMGMRGMTPQGYGQIAEQWGMAPSRWGEVQGMMESVTQGRAGDLMFTAGQYAPLAQFQSRESILRGVFSGELPQLGEGEARRLQHLAGGAPLAWSRLGLEGGDVPGFGQVQPNMGMVTVSPETGMAVGSTWGGGVLAQGIEAGRFTMGALAQGAFQRELEAGNIVINAQEATLAIGGQEVPFTQVGLQDYGRQAQRGYQEYQYGQQMTGLAAQYAYTTGQVPGWAPEGAPDFGRGQWAMQDAMTALQRQYQTVQFGFQGEQLDMQNRQFYDRWGQQAQRAGVQYQWGLQDIGREWGRTQRRFQWAEEDIAYQGTRSTLQYGWGMEDIEEQMRYATGRERRQLMRRQERMTVEYGMGMGRLETEEGRLGERRKWAEEDHNRERNRYEQRYRWSRQDMDMQRRHHEEQMNLARRRQQASEKYFDDTNTLQDEQRDASREYWEWQIDQQRTSVERAHELAEQLNHVQDLMEALAQAQTQQTTWFAAQFQPDGSVSKSWHGLVSDMMSGLGQLRSAAQDYRRYLASNPYGSMSSRK